jgi:fumarate hydratase class I
MLNPSDSIVDWVLKTVPTMGAGWCPPGMLGIGIGGTAEKAMLLAKEALMEPIDIVDLIARGPSNRAEELRLELYEKVNALGIGAQGLGGLTTVLDIKVKDYPTHAANLPVAMIPNCAATRHAHFVLDGSGPVALDPPSLEDWPKLTYDASKGRRVNLDTITREEVQSWKPGETILLNGKLLTGRDAAHKRMIDMLNRGETLPVDFTNRFIYYVGPVDPVRDEVVGPAGPTTATRMDKFTRQMLESTGLLGMVGKSERGPAAIEAIRDNKAVYLMAVGGSAYLVSKAIKASRVLAFEDLGMEAIYEFEVKDMPVTVAVDSAGTSVHEVRRRAALCADRRLSGDRYEASRQVCLAICSSSSVAITRTSNPPIQRNPATIASRVMPSFSPIPPVNTNRSMPPSEATIAATCLRATCTNTSCASFDAALSIACSLRMSLVPPDSPFNPDSLSTSSSNRFAS